MTYISSGIAIIATAENSSSQASSTEKTSMAKARAFASPSPSMRLANSGTKALLKAPSANRARNRLGKRWATKNASATGPVPSVKAISWSRTKPKHAADQGEAANRCRGFEKRHVASCSQARIAMAAAGGAARW